MALYDYSAKRITAKVIYYGPAGSGKATNLRWIYDHSPRDSPDILFAHDKVTAPGRLFAHDKLISLTTETGRIHRLDLRPLDLGTIRGFQTYFGLLAFADEVVERAEDTHVLKGGTGYDKGVDGIVFVADSQRSRLAANVASLEKLEAALARLGQPLETIPVVLQYNKRDVPDCSSVAELNRGLNRRAWRVFEATALSGKEVFSTLKAIKREIVIELRKRR